MQQHENQSRFVTNGRSLFEVISVSENYGLSRDKMPFTGAQLEDCRDGKRYYIDYLLMQTLEQVDPSVQTD